MSWISSSLHLLLNFNRLRVGLQESIRQEIHAIDTHRVYASITAPVLLAIRRRLRDLQRIARGLVRFSARPDRFSLLHETLIQLSDESQNTRSKDHEWLKQTELYRFELVELRDKAACVMGSRFQVEAFRVFSLVQQLLELVSGFRTRDIIERTFKDIAGLLKRIRDLIDVRRQALVDLERLRGCIQRYDLGMVGIYPELQALFNELLMTTEQCERDLSIGSICLAAQRAATASRLADQLDLGLSIRMSHMKAEHQLWCEFAASHPRFFRSWAEELDNDPTASSEAILRWHVTKSFIRRHITESASMARDSNAQVVSNLDPRLNLSWNFPSSSELLEQFALAVHHCCSQSPRNAQSKKI